MRLKRSREYTILEANNKFLKNDDNEDNDDNDDFVDNDEKIIIKIVRIK